ncbi:MAG: PfkB family carbohydrate kinase [Hydrogenophilales bacterium]
MKLNFSGIKVLLIGDFMIDHYILGSSSRISPEAPVPVVIPQSEYSIPGGAGNVAMNLSSLGAQVTCLGYVGDDIWGEKLISLLKENKINTENIEIINNHPTTLKKRIYSNNKQVARIDVEKIIDWTSDFKISQNYDLIILSDYNKGVLNSLWFDIGSFNNVMVDPKKHSFSHYRGAKIITPNLNELQKASSIKIKDDESVIIACRQLINEYDFEYIVAKKGDRGITVVGKDNFKTHIKAHSILKPDVTGAGDSIISALSLCYFKTKDIKFSTIFANAAAAVVVSKTGTSTSTINEALKLI